MTMTEVGRDEGCMRYPKFVPGGDPPIRRNVVKVVGMKKATGEMARCPPGFHVEVWSSKHGDRIEMWTSEYLSQNSWTVNHGADERRVDVEAREIQAIEGWPMTRALKEAAIRVWEE